MPCCCWSHVFYECVGNGSRRIKMIVNLRPRERCSECYAYALCQEESLKKTIMQNEIFNFDIFPCMSFELRWFGLNERMYVCEYFANTNSVDLISAQMNKRNIVCRRIFWFHIYSRTVSDSFTCPMNEYLLLISAFNWSNMYGYNFSLPSGATQMLSMTLVCSTALKKY